MRKHFCTGELNRPYMLQAKKGRDPATYERSWANSASMLNVIADVFRKENVRRNYLKHVPCPKLLVI